MDYYHYSVELPFSKKTIKFREFTTDEQLALGKAQYSFSNDLQTYYRFVYDVISGCVSKDSEFDTLDIIEYILFIIKIRIISVGPKIELMMLIDGQNAKITLDLNILMQNIYNSIDSLQGDLKILENKKIILGFPKILDMLEFAGISTDVNMVLNTLPLFIDKAGIVSKKTDMKKIYDKLPVSVTNSIQSKIFDILKNLGEKEIFGMDVFRDFRLNFYNNSVFDFIKLISSHDVKSIHQEIYLLSQLTPIYVKSLTPSERKIYMNFFLQEKSPKNDNDGSVSRGKTLSPVDALAAEFGQPPLNSGFPS